MSKQNRTEIVISALNETQAAFRNLQESLKGLDKELGVVNQSGKKAGQSFRDSFGSIKAALVGTGIFVVLKQLTDAANQVERANIGLATTARYAGEDLQKVQAAAKSLTEDGLMSVAEASQGLQNLLSRGFSLDEAIVLMNKFKDSAAFNRQASLEFGQAVVSATEGLKNENSILVDNAGVTKNVSIMWKEYAATHGKTVEQLTQAEKRQAEYNGILRETEGQLGNAARMTETYAGQMAKLNQELFEFKAAAGRELTPVLADIAKGLRPVISLVRDFVGGFEMAAVSFAAWWDKLAAFNAAGGVSGLLTSGFKRDWLKQQFAIIDKAAEETKAEIFKRFDVGVTPDIGPDTGKRRSDIVLPGKDGKTKKGKTEKLPSAWEMLQKDSAAFAKAWEEDQKKMAEDAAWITDQKQTFADAIASMLEKSKQLREAEINHQLSLVDTAEAYHQISKAEAAEQRLALNQELLTIQEQWLGSIDKATDPSGWQAQSQVIEETRQRLLELKKTAEALGNNMAAGFSEGLQNYKESIPSLFESSRDAAHGFLDDMEDGFTDLFDNVLRGKVEDFGDFFEQVGNSILSMLAEIMAQMTMASMTGSKGGWGDLISSIAGAIGSAYGGSYDMEGSSFYHSMLSDLLAAKGNATGNVYASPSLSKFSGQVVSKPTYFKFAYGDALGVMGEGSGPEGIFPLARDKSGKLGVRAVGALRGGATNINLHISAIDTQTGMQFIMKNTDAIMAGIASKMGDNHPFRRGR